VDKHPSGLLIFRLAKMSEPTVDYGVEPVAAPDPAESSGVAMKPLECPVCLTFIPDVAGRREIGCPHCGARLVRSGKQWAVIGPRGVPFGPAEDYYRIKRSSCTSCLHLRPFFGFVFAYFFSWAVFVLAVYLGGSDAGWLGGWWKLVGLAIFPVAFKLAVMTWRLVARLFPKDLWRCASAGAVRCAGSDRPSGINLNGRCRFFQRRATGRP